VIHYAVTDSARATAAVLDAREYVSCHVAIDRTGLVIQQVPFDRCAWHAGDSLYQGRPKVSRFSLGIEIANPGPLIKQGDGSFRTTYGKLWTGEVVEAWHENDTAKRGWKFWAGYTPTELDVCAHLVTLWREHYKITNVVGHDYISPGRKSDPGPAFPMVWLRESCFPNLGKTEPPP
jgi:N-acetylmuramoyl-L-alanine amidase